MKKIDIILFIFFNFLLLPNFTFACGTTTAYKSEKNNCNTQTSALTRKAYCCNIHSKDKNHEGCDRKCGHSKCGCSSTCNTLVSINGIISNNTSFNFSPEKQRFYDLNTFISSGYYFLWFIPKIS